MIKCLISIGKIDQSIVINELSQRIKKKIIFESTPIKQITISEYELEVGMQNT